MKLFVKKPIAQLMAAAKETEKTLKRDPRTRVAYSTWDWSYYWCRYIRPNRCGGR